MRDDERALGQLLHDSAPVFEPLDGTQLRARTERHRKRGRVVLPVAVAAAVAGIGVAGFLISHSPAPTHSAGRSLGTSTTSARTSPTQPASTRTPSTRTSSPVTAVDGMFRVNLVLPATTFPADGRPIHAYLQVINGTGRGVVISNACNGWVSAGLSGGPATFGITSLDVGCASKTIPAGTTRMDVSIPTTFTQCQQGKRPGTAELPHCIGPKDSTFPNLPAGTYVAEVQTQSTSVTPILSSPQRVVLTPAR